jgi:hypothetical protein
MSQANLTMKDMFEVQNAKDAMQAMGAATQQELETSQAAAVLKQEVAKKSKLIRWSAVQDVLFEKTVEALDIPVLTFLSPAWKKRRTGNSEVSSCPHILRSSTEAGLAARLRTHAPR